MSEYLYLTTRGWRTGRAHEIEIWFTEIDGLYYVISEKFDRAHWVQNLRRDPAVRFRVGKESFHGTAKVLESAADEPRASRARALSEKKYGWSSGLVVELRPRER